MTMVEYILGLLFFMVVPYALFDEWKDNKENRNR